MAEIDSIKKQTSQIQKTSAPLAPTSAELSVLNATEKFGFRLTHRMNQVGWKRFWTFCQRHIDSLWIKIATYNLTLSDSKTSNKPMPINLCCSSPIIVRFSICMSSPAFCFGKQSDRLNYFSQSAPGFFLRIRSAGSSISEWASFQCIRRFSAKKKKPKRANSINIPCEG